MNKLSSAIKEIFTPGTPLCALAYAALGAILATLLLTIGFWRTLFIAVFAALGALAGRHWQQARRGARCHQPFLPAQG